MGKIFVLGIVLICNSLFAQNCSINSQIAAEYIDDAYFLAIDEIYLNENHEYKDSVEIPQDILDKYLGLISSVSDLDFEANDSIFNQYQIHTFPRVACSDIVLGVEKSLDWVENYLQDSLLSSNSDFDSIVEKYEFRLVEYMELNSMNLIYIRTAKKLNLYPILGLLEEISGVTSVNAQEYWVGDGADIEITFDNSVAYVNFSIGWGDCPAGCINRHYWKFSITQDCSATFIGNYGDKITGIFNKEREEAFNIYPNPFTDFITIDADLSKSKITIFSGTRPKKCVLI